MREQYNRLAWILGGALVLMALAALTYWAFDGRVPNGLSLLMMIVCVALCAFLDASEDGEARTQPASKLELAVQLSVFAGPFAIYGLMAASAGQRFDWDDALLALNLGTFAAVTLSILIARFGHMRRRQHLLRLHAKRGLALMVVLRDRQVANLAVLRVSANGGQATELSGPSFAAFELAPGVSRLVAELRSPLMPAARAELALDLAPGAVAVVRVKVTGGTANGHLVLERIDDRSDAHDALSDLPLAA